MAEEDKSWCRSQNKTRQIELNGDLSSSAGADTD